MAPQTFDVSKFPSPADIKKDPEEMLSIATGYFNRGKWGPAYFYGGLALQVGNSLKEDILKEKDGIGYLEYERRREFVEDYIVQARRIMNESRDSMVSESRADDESGWDKNTNIEDLLKVSSTQYALLVLLQKNYRYVGYDYDY